MPLILCNSTVRFEYNEKMYWFLLPEPYIRGLQTMARGSHPARE